ncbi:MAG: TetR/AcrR family transcriptional regulator [Jatrophihabitans sp.]|uniref:TetR/AcrR family transcriptional regulator n=1 Tax=Jatrophihabitans sp. TaxID=1932789 RepID=UPI003F7E63B5
MSTYRGVPEAERRAARRAALMDAALDALHEDGLAAISVRAVCARSRLTPRYFYESFPDLDALLDAVVDAISDEVIAAAVAAVDGETALDAKVWAAIDAGYGVVADDRRKATAVLICAAGSGPLRLRRHDLLVRFAEVVLTALPLAAADSAAARAEARPLALFLMGGAAEVIEAVLSGALPLSRAQVVDRLSRLWLATLDAASAVGQSAGGPRRDPRAGG